MRYLKVYICSEKTLKKKICTQFILARAKEFAHNDAILLVCSMVEDWSTYGKSMGGESNPITK